MKIDPHFSSRLDSVFALVGDLWNRADFDSELRTYLHEADEALSAAVERLEALKEAS